MLVGISMGTVLRAVIYALRLLISLIYTQIPATLLPVSASEALVNGIKNDGVKSYSAWCFSGNHKPDYCVFTFLRCCKDEFVRLPAVCDRLGCCSYCIL